MYICICKQVTAKQINCAIDNGATTLRELRNELGVASQCGQCGKCAKNLLKEKAPSFTQRSQAALSPVLAKTFPIFDEGFLASK